MKRKTPWRMTSSAAWCDKVGSTRERQHFFWWPNTVTFWLGTAPFEYTYFWETVTLTERCVKGSFGNFWTVIAVNGQTVA